MTTRQKAVEEVNRQLEAYQSFIDEPKDALGKLEGELDTLEDDMRAINQDVVERSNELIVERQLAVRKLSQTEAPCLGAARPGAMASASVEKAVRRKAKNLAGIPRAPG